jgi:uncharacterized membrane protein YgcG
VGRHGPGNVLAGGKRPTRGWCPATAAVSASRVAGVRESVKPPCCPRTRSSRYAPPVRRLSARLASVLATSFVAFLVVCTPHALAAGPPFPPPTDGSAVYDEAGALTHDTVSTLEMEVDAIEARGGAEIAIFVQVDPGATNESNLEAAKELMDQWGVGRRGFDDGLVLLLSLQPDLKHGTVSLYAGSGFNSTYLNEDQLSGIIGSDFVPAARSGDMDGAMRATVAAIDRAVTPGGRERLDRARQINAVVGLGVAPFALLALLAMAFLAWRRDGRDPYFLDSDSILMAGPPADLTPALATVVRNGRSDQRSVTTALMDLASHGWITFHNVDLPFKGEEGGPSLEILPRPAHRATLPRPEAYILDILNAMSGQDRTLDREALGRLHGSMDDFHQLLEKDAVRLGWFSRSPRSIIGRWSGIATAEIVAGIGAGILGWIVPSSGSLLLGVAVGAGGLGTLGFATQMSQRTPNGAMVDGMLKAYRRTLQKTLEQSRSMEQVVADSAVRLLASTPDEAVVWGIALGLHREVAEVLERSLEDRARGTTGGGGQPWYPIWLGTSSPVAGAGADGSISHGGGGIFSGSPIPDVGGMFASLGSIGSPPPSSGGDGGSGGGFSGGSSSGGGGASGSF